MIHFQHVTKTYKGSWKALDDVTLQIAKGEFVFLTGPSGAGKSTLLKMIYMDERPDAFRGGQVLVSFGSENVYDSRQTRDAEIQRFRRMLGIGFQDFKLLDDRDVFENIAFALRVTGHRSSDIRARVFELMALTGISHRRNAFPHTLSGGERQRVAIARAMANDPLLLVADEPTGNLDPENARRVFDILRKINERGTTVVMATHNPELYGSSPFRRLILDRGRLAAKDYI